MMGYEEAHLYAASKDDMETLVVDDNDVITSSSNGAQSFHDPLSLSVPYVGISTTDGYDPLHSEPQEASSSSYSILEPPSYADAVFRSFDASEINGHIHSMASPSSSSSSSTTDYLKISVSDPSTEQNASYYTYLITTLTNVEEFNDTEFNVRRRFRDVVTLSDRLTEAYRGFFIPMRPDKGVVESQVMQKNEFVEQRRAALEKYLRRLAKHPVIRKSEELITFLTAPSFGEITDVNEAGKGGGRDMWRVFKELKQSVTNDWGGVKPPLIEEDKDFLEKKEKFQDFEQQISNVSLQAEALVKSQQDIGETMGQLGLAFVKLTKFETEEAVYESQKKRAVDMKNVATAAVKASRLYPELNTQTVKHLDKLHEYLGLMLAVNNAFSERSSALLTVQTLLSELSLLNSKIEKLDAASSKIFGGDRSRIRKIEELREAVRVTEDAKNTAVREYERIKENNRNELERLEKEKHDDFLSMLRGFIVNQAGYAEKMANVWEVVAEETSTYASRDS